MIENPSASPFNQWKFQDPKNPKMEVPTIYKDYVRAMQGLCKGIYLQNMTLYSTVHPILGS